MKVTNFKPQEEPHLLTFKTHPLRFLSAAHLYSDPLLDVSPIFTPSDQWIKSPTPTPKSLSTNVTAWALSLS